jgi:hypothetical protein
MAKLPDLFVNAVSTWDGKALGKGEKQIGGFEKSVKNLAKSFGLAFSATALIQFGKKSVKAFAEDETAAIRLTKAVNNLGLGFEDTRITRFISDLEKSAAVADDVLRPAFQSLLTTTGSVTRSQELLTLALDVSAGSGVDAAEVSKDLGLAYLGQTKGLAKYNLGLTKAELTAAGFSEIQAKLLNQYSGQNAARLDTYAGKVAAVGIAYGNLQETVGGALIDAFMKLAGDTTVDDLTESVDNLADSLVSVVELTGAVATPFVGLAKLFNDASSAYTKFLFKVTGATYMGVTADRQYGGAAAEKYKAEEEAANAKARAKAEAEAAKRQKELLALQKKSALAEKNKLSLSKAAAVFDSNRISIAAALRATYDKETILRLEALQAIEEDNGELALKKISELAALQKNADLAKLAGVKEISEATLSALNTQLLAELGVIDKSKMAEADKELAREEAFRKYNAAIVAAGQLAAKEQYSERTQIQLTEIARLASQSNTTSALKTQVLLREQAELSMIDRVAAAQKKADDARLAALKTYLALLTGGDLAADPNFAKASPEAQQEVIDATKAAIDALTPELIDPATSDALKAADAVLALAASITPRGTLSSYKQAELDSAVMLNSVGGGGSSRNNVYNLNFTTGVISQPDEFATLLQDTIQKLNRGGDPLTVAGVL